MKRLALLIYNLKAGGAERVLCKWSFIFSKKYEVFIYNFEDSSPEYPFFGNRVVLRAPSKKGSIAKIINVLKRAQMLRKQLKRDNIDCIISFCPSANFPVMFQKINKYSSIRLYSEYFTNIKKYRFLIKHTKTKIIAQTERLKSDIISDVGEKYSSKILVFGNPLETNDIIAKAAERPEQNFINFVQGKKVICFTSSFKRQKNHWNLLKSFFLLKEMMDDVCLVLIGANGEFEKDIHDMASDSRIKECIYFVGRTENPFKYEKFSNVFVLPSLSEGMPNALLEAMTLGIPVISTDCPSGPRELLYETPVLTQKTTEIEYADYGILVQEFDDSPSFDFECFSNQNKYLAEAIRRVLTDDKLSKKYSDAAARRSKQFNINEYENALLELIKIGD